MHEYLANRNKNPKLDAIETILRKVPAYDKNNVPIYVVAGGMAVYLLDNPSRVLSDLDVVSNNVGPDSLYHTMRNSTMGDRNVECLHIDVVSLNRDIFGSLRLTPEELVSISMPVKYKDLTVPIFCPEAIIASKIASKYVFKDVLRDKDVSDIFLLKNQPLDYCKLNHCLNLVPREVLPEQYSSLDLVVEKTMLLHDTDEELARKMMKFSRKVSKKLYNSPSMISDYYEILNCVNDKVTDADFGKSLD